MPRTHYPRFDPALRIAVLTPNLTLRQMLRRMCNCRAVAADVPVLRSLAEAVESGKAALRPVDAAVIAFTGIKHGELTVLERDLFWRVFQVPVFEQFLAPDGRILAMECDAHDGPHLLDSNSPIPGFRAFLDHTPCACGNRHPRLSRLERLEHPPGHIQGDKVDRRAKILVRIRFDSGPFAIRVRIRRLNGGTSTAVPAHVHNDRDREGQLAGVA